MSISILYAIRQQLDYYDISILLITGNIGNLFIILMLERSLKQYSNSCSIYLLFASITNWFINNTELIFAFYGLDHVEPTHSSNSIS